MGVYCSMIHDAKCRILASKYIYEQKFILPISIMSFLSGEIENIVGVVLTKSVSKFYHSTGDIRMSLLSLRISMKSLVKRAKCRIKTHQNVLQQFVFVEKYHFAVKKTGPTASGRPKSWTEPLHYHLFGSPRFPCDSFLALLTHSTLHSFLHTIPLTMYRSDFQSMHIQEMNISVPAKFQKLTVQQNMLSKNATKAGAELCGEAASVSRLIPTYLDGLSMFHGVMDTVNIMISLSPYGTSLSRVEKSRENLITTCVVPVRSCFDIFMPVSYVVSPKYAVYITTLNGVQIVVKRYV
ncbi:hypothetical protein WN51_14177 [Melipona quadrifasciata]|uniref:Uncharacterized protein n=1 Tax=Melipona quadrifasciata TaxID=166423 RepID=A0A0M8ZZI2_9HYME|nr:hypothetical protein WN51_14177 [Melipona quadrifasciata]